MTRFSITDAAPPHWDRICEAHGALFHSRQWQELINQSFRAANLYGWSEERQLGCAISVFRAGPFRVAYAGFPVGGAVGDGGLTREDLADLCAALRAHRIACLRVPVSAFGDPLSLEFPFRSTPETAIPDLASWNPDAFAKLRHDISRVRRGPLIIADAPRGDILHALYRATVRNHRGNERYNAAYFDGLVALARERPDLRCRVALCEGVTAGFLVAAKHCGQSYYLHGASAQAFKKHAPSDALLYDAISWAQREQAQGFNLMTSPPEQPSLVRYKEKWGATTRAHKTYTIPVRAMACTAFQAAEYLHGKLR